MHITYFVSCCVEKKIKNEVLICIWNQVNQDIHLAVVEPIDILLKLQFIITETRHLQRGRTDSNHMLSGSLAEILALTQQWVSKVSLPSLVFYRCNHDVRKGFHTVCLNNYTQLNCVANKKSKNNFSIIWLYLFVYFF